MAAGEIRGHGPHYVCGGSHEDIYRGSAIDEGKKKKKKVSRRICERSRLLDVSARIINNISGRAYKRSRGNEKDRQRKRKTKKREAGGRGRGREEPYHFAEAVMQKYLIASGRGC